MNLSDVLKQATTLLNNNQNINVNAILQLTNLISGVLIEQKQDKFYFIGFKQNTDGSDYKIEIKLSKDEYKLLRSIVLIMKPAITQIPLNNSNIKITPYNGGYSNSEVKDFIINNSNQPDKLLGFIAYMLDVIDDEIYKNANGEYIIKMNPVIYYFFVFLIIFVSLLSTINPNLSQGYFTFDSLIKDIEKVKKGEPIDNLVNAAYITIWVVANRFIEQAEKDNMTTYIDIGDINNIIQSMNINPNDIINQIKK